MEINIIQIIVIIILAGLFWYANNALNPIPVLKTVVNVLIVVISVLMVLSNMGLISGTHVSVH